MKTLSLEARLMALGALTVMLSVSPIATAIAAPSDSTARPTRPVRVTTADVEASNKKVAAAYAALVQMWSNEFKHIGTRFAAPRILRYDGNVYSSCGIMRANNAEYCQRDNTIYYDQVFVAGMEKLA